jgi:hypothetical protein
VHTVVEETTGRRRREERGEEGETERAERERGCQTEGMGGKREARIKHAK